MSAGSETATNTTPDVARRALRTVRWPRAAGPGTSAQSLRHAYLELLKLSLCDLAATTTVSVGRTESGDVASRELEGEQLRLRAAGMDWPLQGLTMVGLERLDDLQICVETIVREGVKGDLIEAGTWRGGASILMRATLDSLGADERGLWVADSFQGFPEKRPEQRASDQWAPIDYLAVPLAEVQANFARLGCDRNVHFVPGFFADTLPNLAGRPWSLIRLDGDTYDATWTALEALYPGLSVGGCLVVDDYGAIEECRAAVDEFRDQNGITEALESPDWTCVRWRRTSEPSPPGGPSTQLIADVPHEAARTVARPAASEVPTFRELALSRELKSASERLRTAEAELESLRSTRALRAWTRARRLLGRGDSR